MSFINDIIKFGLGRFGIEPSSDTATLVQSAVSELLNTKSSSAIKKSNKEPEIERTEIKAKLDIKADTKNQIPVVYGTSWVKGHLIDAQLTNNNCTMWYAIVLSEVTGDLIDGTPSEIEIEQVNWNDQRLVFRTDGNTALQAQQFGYPNVPANDSPRDQIFVYCYNNGSESPARVRNGGSSVQHGNAYDIMPGWTADHQMSNLVFAIVRVDYSAEKDIKGLGDLTFKLKNTMTKPGDVLYDYMTNTLYGAGIPTTEIDV